MLKSPISTHFSDLQPKMVIEFRVYYTTLPRIYFGTTRRDLQTSCVYNNNKHKLLRDQLASFHLLCTGYAFHWCFYSAWISIRCNAIWSCVGWTGSFASHRAGPRTPVWHAISAHIAMCSVSIVRNVKNWVG